MKIMNQWFGLLFRILTCDDALIILVSESKRDRDDLVNFDVPLIIVMAAGNKLNLRGDKGINRLFQVYTIVGVNVDGMANCYCDYVDF